MRKAVLAGVAAVSLAGAAIAAPTGAPQDGAMQAGGWGPGGWQSGAYAPGPMDRSPMMPPPPMMGPPMGGAPMMHGDYKPAHPGQRLTGPWRDPSLTVSDWQAWGLGAPGQGMHWIRYYDDAVLVDADDRVVTTRGGIPWDAPRHGWHDHDPGEMGGMGWHHPPIMPGTTSYRAGPDTVVTTQVIAPPPIVYGGGYDGGYGSGYGYGAGYGYAGAGSTVVVSPGIVTTTTTTTTERVWHKVPVRGCRCARPIRSGKLVRR